MAARHSMPCMNMEIGAGTVINNHSKLILTVSRPEVRTFVKQVYIMYDSRFSQRWLRKMSSSGMWRRAVLATAELLVSANVVPSSLIFSSWWWRRYVPPKRRLFQESHGVTSQKKEFLKFKSVCATFGYRSNIYIFSRRWQWKSSYYKIFLEARHTKKLIHISLQYRRYNRPPLGPVRSQTNPLQVYIQFL
jgi:hypothetical protein